MVLHVHKDSVDNIDIIAAANTFVRVDNKENRSRDFGVFSERDLPKPKPKMHNVQTNTMV